MTAELLRTEPTRRTDEIITSMWKKRRSSYRPSDSDCRAASHLEKEKESEINDFSLHKEVERLVLTAVVNI